MLNHPCAKHLSTKCHLPPTFWGVKTKQTFEAHSLTSLTWYCLLRPTRLSGKPPRVAAPRSAWPAFPQLQRCPNRWSIVIPQRTGSFSHTLRSPQSALAEHSIFKWYHVHFSAESCDENPSIFPWNPSTNGIHGVNKYFVHLCAPLFSLLPNCSGQNVSGRGCDPYGACPPRVCLDRAAPRLKDFVLNFCSHTGSRRWSLIKLHRDESGHMLSTVAAPGTVIFNEASTLGKNAAKSFQIPYISVRNPTKGHPTMMMAMPRK